MQIVLALTVAAVVQLRLRTSGTCLLGAGGNSVIVGGNVVGNGSDNPSSAPIFSSRSSSCSFAYTAAAASIFASFALSLARCAGVKAGLWLEGSLSAALAGWWVVAAVVFSFDASRANAIGWVVGVERVVFLDQKREFFLERGGYTPIHTPPSNKQTNQRKRERGVHSRFKKTRVL